MRMLRTSLLACALLASAAAPRVARAQTAAAKGDMAAAEALWNEARKLRAAGDIKAACPKFVESYRLDPALGTLLNMASCHEIEGRIATAWSEYRDAEQQAARAKDRDREGFAKKRAAALEPRLPRLVIAVIDPPEGLAIERDGVVLGQAAMETALPIDPGEHTITAKAPGKEPWSKTIEALSGQRVDVTVPALRDRPPEPSPEADVAAGDIVAPQTSSEGRDHRKLGIALAGAGVLALGVGAAFGVATGAEASDADAHCPEKRCDPTGDAAIANATTYAWVSNVSFGVGLAAAAVGAYFFFSSEVEGEPASFAVAPAVGPGGGGVTARVVF